MPDTKTPKQILAAALEEIRDKHGIIITELEVAWREDASLSRVEHRLERADIKGRLT